MIVISIPRYRKVRNEEGKYTVFEIHVSKPGASNVIEKRYSNFVELDKRLRKIIYTPNLPSRTPLNKGTKFLETRREGLERYLQELIGTNFDIYDILSEFLEIQLPIVTSTRPRTTTDADDLDAEDYTIPQITHQNLLHFTKDPVISFYQRDKNFIKDWNCIPDAVIRGVIAGIYENDGYAATTPTTSKFT